MRQKIKIFFQVFIVVLAMAAVLGFFVHLLFFYKAENGSQKYLVSLTGEFSPSKKTFSVKKGIVSFETFLNNSFLLDHGDGIGRGKYPWEEAVFIKATFNGVTKKLSAANCRMSIPRDGELILEISYNPEFFDPKIVKISTGVRDNSSTGFTDSHLLVKIRQYKSGDEIGKMPEVEDFVISKARTELEVVVVKNSWKTFFGIPPDLPEDGGEEFFAPFSIKKQEEIKRRNKASNDEVIRIWKKIFSPNDKGEK
ncbi:hypothetical protein KAS41_03685, partial [Candidatus Parcubacteria bacterium]|nr:hypothetical protein [Candidatus Parcubacteria bacterium]